MLMIRENDIFFLTRCFDLALLSNGSTSPNPCVGSVIVFKDEIIGEGLHQYYGGAHAEVNAVASVSITKKHLIPEATIYVSLEPCFHFGKTPPCVDLMLKESLKKVVIAFKDPNPKVAGQSIEKLRLNKVEVNLQNDNKGDTNFSKNNIAQPFFTNILQQRPYIILKWAESTNGFIGNKNEQTTISNELSKRLVHKWRSECDGIMVGTNTAETDNPALNNRYYFGKSPIRIVLDRTNRLDANLHIFDNTLKTIIYTEGGDFLDKKGENIEIQPIPFDNHLLDALMKDLLSKKIAILLVEGGATLLNSFIEKNLWDEARVIKSSNPISDLNGIPAPKISHSYITENVKLADNTVTFYKNI
jgi:diaminohydroxyphosphoribosylaminopyrimidine deaminase / 5-amino-6-(5-phosphoribosylamino)uracil reductase